MQAAGKYEIRKILGEGGMGIVYLALDPEMNREVALKTIRDPQNAAVLELFKRECAVLTSLTHPNIIEIYDIGQIDAAGTKQPYFVMPLLRGATLLELIKTSSPRLTVERSLQIFAQICRGLQAAHDHDLIHRDIKPSNLFILDDDSVKIIDFGVARLADHRSIAGLKGTLPYMAPEQVQMKQPSILSDQFSLAVVCYEVLARRHPFHPFNMGAEEELANAIQHVTPPPITEINPVVSAEISQVIHKALAKEPLYRFSSVREFSNCLQKAFRGEPIEIFDSARIAPRLLKARKSFDSDDLDGASEIVRELESESYLNPEIGELRKLVDDTRRAKTIKQLMETARRRFDEEEYNRALQKVQEVLDLDPNNTEAYTLKFAIESKRSGTQIEEWFRLANQHMENHAYGHARQALEKVLDLRPKDPRATALLAEVGRREHEHVRTRNEKQQAYQSAVDAVQRGDLDSALNKLERVLDLDRRAPYSTSPEQGVEYQKLYEDLRSKRELLSSQEVEARRHLNEGNFVACRLICEEVLTRYPNHVVFQVLREDVEQAQRQEISAYVANVEKAVASEFDLNRKVSILEEAKAKYPLELRFEQALQEVRARRDRVDSIAARARSLEETKQFTDALGQWETLRNIYPKYPGLDIEIDRVKKRREQQARTDAQSHWVAQIDQALAVHNYAKAISLAADALVEFPGDPELMALAKQAGSAQTRGLEAEDKTNRGKELYSQGRVEEALALLRAAFELNSQNPIVRSGLLEVLLKEASGCVDADWRASERFVQEALEIDSASPLGKSLATLIKDKRQAEEVSLALSGARELQAKGAIKEAVAEIDGKLLVYPREQRLVSFRAALLEQLSTDERATLRARDLEKVQALAKESGETSDPQQLDSIFQKSTAFTRYDGDAEFHDPLSMIESRLRTKREKEAIPQVGPLAAPPPAPAPLPASPQANTKPATPERKASWIRNGPSRGLILKVLWVVIGFAIVAPLFFWLSRSQPGPVQESFAPRVTVVVSGATVGQYSLLDSGGNDVTSKTVSGFLKGPYTLKAQKPGFTAEQPVTIDPAEGNTKSVSIVWQPLPTEVEIVLAPQLPPAQPGSLKVDGQDQHFDGDGKFRTNWQNGPHSIQWSTPDGNSLDMSADVKNDTATLNLNGLKSQRLSGLLATVSQSLVTTKLININGGVTKTIEDQAEPLDTTKPFSLSTGHAVDFKSKNYPLVGSIKAEPGGQPAVLVYLIYQRPASPGGRTAPPVIPPPLPKPDPNASSAAPPPPPPSPPPADVQKKNDDDEKKKRLEKLGLKL